MDQVKPHRARRHRKNDRASQDWLTWSLSDPIRWRPCADPGQKRDTGDWIRAPRGLTTEGPLQKARYRRFCHRGRLPNKPFISQAILQQVGLCPLCRSVIGREAGILPNEGLMVRPTMLPVSKRALWNRRSLPVWYGGGFRSGPVTG